MVELAKWDTDNFGFKTGNLVIPGEFDADAFPSELESAKNCGYKLLYLKGVDVPDGCLSDNVRLVDEKIVYTQLNRRGLSAETNGNVVSILGEEMTDELFGLACLSGKYSRYRLDEKLPPTVFPTLYKLWMERSLNGTIATDVLAYREQGQTLGILTWQLDGDAAHIGLVATAEKAARKGIGKALMTALFQRIGEGMKISVATQKANIPACLFYEKNGFSLESSTKIYHIWL